MKDSKEQILADAIETAIRLEERNIRLLSALVFSAFVNALLMIILLVF